MSSAAIAQSDLTTESGWPYEVLRPGNGPQLTRKKAAETHNQLIDASGRVLGSTYTVGIPDYQIISELPAPFQEACEVMSEGGKYLFRIPVEDFKAATKKGSSINFPGEHIVWEIEVIKVLPPLPDIAGIIKRTSQQSGLDAAFREFQKLSSGRSGKVYLGEWKVNATGYLFLGEGRIEEAIEVFQFNTQRNPRSANAHDSLAEAYLKNGNKKMAVKHYRRSLELNPDNQNARNMLSSIGQ